LKQKSSVKEQLDPEKIAKFEGKEDLLK